MEALTEHNNTQDGRIKAVEQKCDTADKTINSMRTDIAVIKMDLGWVKKIQWAVLTMSSGSIAAALINLFFNVVEKGR
jgi:hypothetical protein